jgi:hypothetical protein
MMSGNAITMLASLRTLVGLASLLLLMGCGGDRLGSSNLAPGAASTRVGSGPSPAPTDMTGRWMLSASGGGACGMNLAGGAAAEGTIRPEGGCPGNFFTSRKWTFEDGALVLRNHNGESLGQLKMASAGRFEGQSATGQQVSLAR